ncbi:MAG TPA: isocitrate lyase/PEP mutase family protein [Burkholderiales bacterium]|nr:isocitrate lyase/PEP mutase family protein [Burkholderiales bacterium]
MNPTEKKAQPVSETKARRMREMLASGKIVVSPGVFDGYSVRLVEAMGFQAASTTGAGLSNSRLGQPDIGVMTLRDNVEACYHIARSVSIPVMSDADTGYGNAVTVYHTVRYFEEAGVVGINIEDQVSPKRCGHMRGKELISAAEMAKKIESAIKARRDPDFIINARTDAIAVEGPESAIERAKVYLAAGADMVYPDAIGSEDQIRRFVDAVEAPVSISMGLGLRGRVTTPLVSVKRLQAIGVARVSYSRMLTSSALKGMKNALQAFREYLDVGEPPERPDLAVSAEEISELMGYAFVNELESQFLLDEQIEKKYGGGKVDYVVRGRERT